MKVMGTGGKLCCIAVMLISGTFNTLNNAVQFRTCVPYIRAGQDQTARALAGCPEGYKHFDKPWMQNVMMFIGEFTLLPIYAVGRIRSAARRKQQGKQPRPPDASSPFLFAVPAFCDVFGSGLASVGMMFISAAVWQMMRGSLIIFTSILTVVVLKRQLQTYHWVSVGITICGLLCVGWAAVADSRDNTSAGNSVVSTITGISFVLVAQITAAFQYVLEEYMLQGMRLSAKKTIGMEGFWGMLYMIVMVTAMNYLPGPDHGREEYLPEVAVMFTGSSTLRWLGVSFMACIAVYNFSGLTVTQHISAMTRCLIDSCRTMLVWFVSLGLFYGGFPQYGTPWTQNSPLQLLGFALLVIGTLGYNKVIRLPGLTYAQVALPTPAAVWSPKITGAKGMDDAQFSPLVSPAQSPDVPSFQDDDVTMDYTVLE